MFLDALNDKEHREHVLQHLEFMMHLFWNDKMRSGFKIGAYREDWGQVSFCIAANSVTNGCIAGAARLCCDIAQLVPGALSV